MGNRFDYRFPILNLQKGKRNNGRYRDYFHTNQSIPFFK